MWMVWKLWVTWDRGVRDYCFLISVVGDVADLQEDAKDSFVGRDPRGPFFGGESY